MEDTYIIELFWSRDESAIQLVDKKYNSTCYSIAWKILMNREDSEECVNDTWFAAWRYIPPKRPPKLVAFLGKITRGFAIDMLRKKHEVILTNNSLLVSVNLDAETEYDGIGISVGESIKINGREYACDSSRVYQKQNLEEKKHQYVVEWIYDEGVPLTKKADIELGIVVHKQIEDMDGETFTFAFSASKEELQKNTVHLNLNQVISLSEGEAVIRDFSINNVTSSLKLESDKFYPEENQYYVEITDMQGDKYRYSLVKKDDKLFTFQNDEDIPSSNSEWLDGQIFSLSYAYDAENKDSMDFGTIGSGESEIFKVDFAEMQPVGQKFRIKLKE